MVTPSVLSGRTVYTSTEGLRDLAAPTGHTGAGREFESVLVHFLISSSKGLIP